MKNVIGIISFIWNNENITIEMLEPIEIEVDNYIINPLWFMNQLSIKNPNFRRIK